MGIIIFISCIIGALFFITVYKAWKAFEYEMWILPIYEMIGDIMRISNAIITCSINIKKASEAFSEKLKDLPKGGYVHEESGKPETIIPQRKPNGQNIPPQTTS